MAKIYNKFWFSLSAFLSVFCLFVVNFAVYFRSCDRAAERQANNWSMPESGSTAFGAFGCCRPSFSVSLSFCLSLSALLWRVGVLIRIYIRTHTQRFIYAFICIYIYYFVDKFQRSVNVCTALFIYANYFSVASETSSINAAIDFCHFWLWRTNYLYGFFGFYSICTRFSLLCTLFNCFRSPLFILIITPSMCLFGSVCSHQHTLEFWLELLAVLIRVFARQTFLTDW